VKKNKPADAPSIDDIPAPSGELALQTIAMPRDTNANGDIFGGWLLSQMDLAGSSVATRRAQGRVVTIAITEMIFHKPVFIGDEVTCYAEIVKSGRTSITVSIESWVRRARGADAEEIKVTAGLFTYVAVDPDRKPRALP
jgi:acyl-CoA thioesterase YciA